MTVGAAREHAHLYLTPVCVTKQPVVNGYSPNPSCNEWHEGVHVKVFVFGVACVLTAEAHRT